MIPCFRQTTRTSYDRNCRQPRIGNVPRPGNSMDRNHVEKHCDKRFLDRVINLIPDSGLKALWSLIPFFWALSLFLWALIPVIFWALSPEPIYHVTTLEPDERRRVGRPKITLKKILEDDTGLEARELQTVMLDRVSWRKNFVMSPIFSDAVK